MGNKHLSLKPKIIQDSAWWYEEPSGISVVHEIREGDRYIRTDTLNIPWRQIRAALKRKDKEAPRG